MKRELNISNYEEWMVDHMDGVLSPEEQEHLHQFLAAHPELAEDWNLLENSVLIPDETVSLPMKASLKKVELDDEAIITLIEEGGDLNVLNGSQRQLASIYAKTKLEADERISFPDKALLRRSEGRVVPLWFKAASIAATLLLAFFLLPSDIEPTYVAREGEPAAWEVFEFDAVSIQESLPLAESTVDKEPDNPEKTKVSPTQVVIEEPLLVDIPSSEISFPNHLPSQELELPKTQLSDLSEPDEDQPSIELPIEYDNSELAEDVNPSKPEYTPVSKKLQTDRPYTTALDLLKKATTGSDVLAIQDVDPEAAYVQTSLKLGRFEVAVKRKKKN